MSDDEMGDERRGSSSRGKSRSSRADSNNSSSNNNNNNNNNKGRSKGRGFQRSFEGDQERYLGKAGQFESLEDTGDTDAQPSVEGWIVIATNIHEEAQEDDLYELFADYGEIKQIHLNLDRRTGYVKGYSLIEFETFREAKAAIDALNGKTLLDKPLTVDWAFKKPAGSGRRERRSGGGSSSQSSSNRRSREVRKRGEQRDEDDE